MEKFWGISYLRQNLQDLKAEVREIRRSIEELRIETHGRMDSLYKMIFRMFVGFIGAMIGMTAIILGVLRTWFK